MNRPPDCRRDSFELLECEHPRRLRRNIRHWVEGLRSSRGDSGARATFHNSILSAPPLRGQALLVGTRRIGAGVPPLLVGDEENKPVLPSDDNHDDDFHHPRVPGSAAQAIHRHADTTEASRGQPTDSGASSRPLVAASLTRPGPAGIAAERHHPPQIAARLPTASAG